MKPGHTNVTVGSSGAAREPASEQCRAVTSVLSRIGDKWSVLVVMALGDGTLRFNELKRRIAGISQRMLTLTLRGLERDGLVEREAFLTIPPRVDYSLTELGRSLREPVDAIGQWAFAHGRKVERARDLYDARAKDRDSENLRRPAVEPPGGPAGRAGMREEPQREEPLGEEPKGEEPKGNRPDRVPSSS